MNGTMDALKITDLTAVPWTNPNDVPSVYCNNASVAIAPWDIRILFSEILTTSNAGELAIVLRANVTMNPAHAKALAGALASSVEAYEENFGKITVPNVAVPNTDGQIPAEAQREL
jgi:hypothetical protein